MPTARPFARNTGAAIAGTTQIGNLAIGTPTAGFAATGLPWWNGPDEDLGYVIATEVPSNNQPTPVPATTASVGFWRSTAKTDSSFIDLAQYVSRIAGSPQTFATASAAYTWLTTNGYWTSYPILVTNGLVMHVDAADPTSWPGSGNSWIDISGAGFNMNIQLDQGAGYMGIGGSANPIFNSANGGSFDCEPSAAMGSANSIPNFFSSGNGYSVEMWIRLTSFRGFESSGGSTLLFLTLPNFSSVNSNGWILLMGNVASGNLTFNLYQGWVTLRGSVSVLSNSDLNNWVQIVLTVDNVANGQIMTYRNGAQASTSTISTQMSLSNTRPIISGYNPVFPQTGSYCRYGIIRLYNKRLSASEVSQNFAANKGRFGL